MAITTPIHENQYRGCLKGLALGDVLGAPFEGGPLERSLWRLLGKTSEGVPRWTDDTQMSIDTAEELLDDISLNQDALAHRFADSYRWTRGYGPSTTKLLKRIRQGQAWQTASKAIHPTGSYGNGAAMRAPVLAMFFPDDRKQLIDVTYKSAVITHAHPLGIHGAILIALCTEASLHRRSAEALLSDLLSYCAQHEQKEFSTQLSHVEEMLARGRKPECKEVRARLGNGITAITSCATAIYLALVYRATDFMDLIHFAQKLGGDVDTICAMSGALWGAYNGDTNLPDLAFEEKHRIETLSMKIYEQIHQKK